MDTITEHDLFDTSGLDLTMPDIPDLSPDDETMVAALMNQAKAKMSAKAQLRASRRKMEDPTSGPSQKISIRLPRPLLGLLREQAALVGMPYQTYMNMMLHDAATK